MAVDFCHPDEPLDAYQAVVVPSLYLMTERQGANLVSYVEAGGTAVISFWSGVVDERDSVYLGPYGGPVRPLMGCDVLDVAPLPVGAMLELQWEDGETAKGALWADVTAETSGHALACYSSGPLSGRPAILETSYGSGRAYYLGCRLDQGALARLYSAVAALRADPAVERAGARVERVVRVATDRRYEFLINYSDEQREIEVPDGGLELLTGTVPGHRVTLGPAGVAIVRYPRGSGGPPGLRPGLAP